MSASPNRTIIILGSGPGIGVGVASQFASQTFNAVALLSRDATRLQTDTASVRAAASGREVDVRAYPVDLADTKALEGVLERVVSELGPPEVVVYNAARVGGGKFFEADEESVLRDFRISVLGLYTTARILTPHLSSLSADPTRRPSLLITSGGLYKDPFHKYFSLSLSKAAQFSLGTTLGQRFAPDGVHVASVVVHGFVRPDSEHFSPQKIASVFWTLYEQGAKGEKEVWVTDGKGWERI